MFNNLFILFASIFLLLTGIAQTTNLQVVWMSPITGLSALIAGLIGVVCFIVYYTDKSKIP